MSPWLLLFLAGALALYLLVILPLVRDENWLGRTVVVAPSLKVTLKGHHTRKRVVALVRRWERGWNGTKGEQRIEPQKGGLVELPAVTVKSWAARVVPHQPATEQWLYVVTGDGVDDEASWTHTHRSYDDAPLELHLTV